MNERLRQSLIGLIWPGPIAGPLPVTTFRILAPVLVLYLRPLPAALIMSFVTASLSVFYFRLLELTGGKEFVEGLLLKLPPQTYAGVKTRGPLALFATSVLVGVFPYAIFLKLLRHREITSEVLLIIASTASSFVWTGLFWGSVVEILKQTAGFAF